MANENNSTKPEHSLQKIQEATEPQAPCRRIDLWIKGFVTDSNQSVIKDQSVQNSCSTTTTRDSRDCAFHDSEVSDNTSELEKDGFLLVTDFLLKDCQIPDALCTDTSREDLAFKMRMLRYYELLAKICSISAQHDGNDTETDDPS